MEGYQVLDHERGEGVMEEEEVGRGEHLTLASPVFMEQLFWTFPQILHRILEIKMETQAPDPKFRDPAQQSCSKCLGRAGRSFCGRVPHLCGKTLSAGSIARPAVLQYVTPSGESYIVNLFLFMIYDNIYICPRGGNPRCNLVDRFC